MKLQPAVVTFICLGVVLLALLNVDRLREMPRVQGAGPRVRIAAMVTLLE